jgi:hypothetical protein
VEAPPRALPRILAYALDPAAKIEPVGSVGRIAMALVAGLSSVGASDAARAVLARLLPLAQRPDVDTSFVAHIAAVEAFHHHHVDFQPGPFRAAARRSRDLMLATGDQLGLGAAWIHVSASNHTAGQVDEAIAAAHECIAVARASGNAVAQGMAEVQLAAVDLLFHGDLPAAVARLQALSERRAPPIGAHTTVLLAYARALEGRHDAVDAMTVAEAARRQGGRSMLYMGAATSALARGRHEEAIAEARRGISEIARTFSLAVERPVLEVVLVDGLLATGRDEEARAELRGAHDRILALAATLDGEPEAKASFITRVPPVARLLSLAERHLPGAARS